MEHRIDGLARDVRDFRLDACRGIALWFVFLDHIPNNIAAWLTLRNYGFSDASEVFVFISGYTCMIAYGARLRQDGWPSTIRHAVRRSCEIYLAFLILLAAHLSLIWLIGRRVPWNAKLLTLAVTLAVVVAIVLLERGGLWPEAFRR